MKQLPVGLITILVLMVVGLCASQAEAAVRCPEGSQYVCKRNNQCFCRAYRGYSTPYAYRRPYVRPFLGLPFVGGAYVRRPYVGGAYVRRPYVGNAYVRRGYVGRPLARGYVRRGLWR
jgi:hypothetical protein